MLGQIVLVYPHPCIPTDLPIVGIVTRESQVEELVSITLFPHPGIPLPTTKQVATVRVVADRMEKIAGYRGGYVAVPLDTEVPEKKRRAQPK